MPTVFDFGLNGKPSTHPPLLDWLAVELMDPMVTPLRKGEKEGRGNSDRFCDGIACA